MATLLVGGSSMLGKHLVNSWASDDLVVSSRNRDCKSPIDLSGPITPQQIPDGVRNVVVVAAQMPESGVPVSTFVEVNALGVLRLAEACVVRNVETFVLVSTISASYPPNHQRFDAYAATKRMGEDSLSLLRRSIEPPKGERDPMAISSLRMGVLYGSIEANSRTPLLTSLAQAIYRGKPIVFTGSENSRRGMTHVDDAVAAIATAQRLKLSGTYTCVSHNSTLTELVNGIAAALDVLDPPKVHFSGVGESVPDATHLEDGTEAMSEVTAWSIHREFSVSCESIRPTL